MQFDVRAVFERLHAASRREPSPTLDERDDRLRRLERLLVDHREDFVRAADQDFGGRAREETLLADVLLTVDSVRHARRHLGEWMRPVSADPHPFFRPSRALVESLPLGVVGVIAPWNYPVNLALGPAAAALAAGNRVLVKPSELTPCTAKLCAELVHAAFSAEELVVVEGGPEVSRAVSELPLDHLLFTGSTAIGRLVAKACAENLVPVTLELGGKSPAFVQRDYPMAVAARRIALGKLFNAGQTCIAPDYALVPEGAEPAFLDAFRGEVAQAWPLGASDPSYTSIISDRHHARLTKLVDEARAKGIRTEVLGGAATSRRFPPTVVVGTPAQFSGLALMEEELFGPLLPVLLYRDEAEALSVIHARPRPLAFYVFDEDERRGLETLRQVTSGGACLNDVLVHFAQEHLPFGGVGASGHGAYHGRYGFEALSHRRGVLLASRRSPAHHLLSPPYGTLLRKALDGLIRFGRFS